MTLRLKLTYTVVSRQCFDTAFVSPFGKACSVNVVCTTIVFACIEGRVLFFLNRELAEVERISRRLRDSQVLGQVLVTYTGRGDR